MRRVRVIWLLSIAVGLVALCLPTSALAGTYTWNLASNFTTAPPGANPDHDPYGGTPWSYVESQAGTSASHNPATFTRLTAFAAGVDGGLSVWSDPQNPTSQVGLNATAAAVTAGEDKFPAGQAFMAPPMDRFVAIGWTSPLSQTATVQVSGSLSPDDSSGVCLGRPTWTVDENGTPVQLGSTLSGSIAGSLTVAPGQSIYLTVSPGASQLTDPACSVTAVALTIKAALTNGPRVTLSSPAPGAVISGTQPTFSGSASNGFGASSAVTVLLYKGSSPSGAPVETLRTSRTGTGYSVGASSTLVDGQYTARAEQDDLASPPDAGLSAPVTFTVHNAPPSIKLGSPGRKALLTATPTLSGTAGTSQSDSGTVTVVIYRGGKTNGKPVRTVVTSVHGGGAYSVRVTPPLADGQYTAVAKQESAGSAGVSVPQIFHIKIHPPAVTLQQPAAGASTNETLPLFSGIAGTVYGDSSVVTVLLYNGRSVTSRPAGTMQVKADGAAWSAHWRAPLPLGLYTARVKQTDDAGHVGYSKPHTFAIVSGLSVVGPEVAIDAGGRASTTITCAAPASATCAGSVLVVTSQSFQPMPGGPAGQVQVLFAYVKIPGGQTQTVTQTLESTIAQELRRAAPLQVQVTTQLGESGGPAQAVSVMRELRAT